MKGSGIPELWRAIRIVVLVLWTLLLGAASVAYSFDGRGWRGLVVLPFALTGWVLAIGLSVVVMFPLYCLSRWRKTPPRSPASPPPG